jgi:hypothetical protein
MHRTGAELIDLFGELAVVGRRAIKRGPFASLERLARARQAEIDRSVELLPQRIATLAERMEARLQRQRDAFDEVDTAIGSIRDEWASESLFFVDDWSVLDGFIDDTRGCTFGALLRFMDEHHSSESQPDIQHVLDMTGLTPSAVLGADTHARLEEYSGEEVLTGYGRLTLLTEVLRSGGVPDERFTDAERLLYLRSTRVDERMRDWLFHDMWRYTDTLRSRQARAEQVSKLIVLYPSAEHVATYLTTVYRTYIEGFIPETIIMCRSLLERSTERACVLLKLERSGEGQSALRSQLKALKDANWLTSDLLRDANTVRLRGNKAVHEDPSVVQDSFGTVEAALRVVNVIEAKSLQHRDSLS